MEGRKLRADGKELCQVPRTHARGEVVGRAVVETEPDRLGRDGRVVYSLKSSKYSMTARDCS